MTPRKIVICEDHALFADGLRGLLIKVRTETLGGRIEINSRAGKGTQVLIEIPYH